MKEMILNYKVINGQLTATLSGKDTITVKEEIKSLGFNWNGDTREWTKAINASEFKSLTQTVIEKFSLEARYGQLKASDEAQAMIKTAM